MDQNTPVEPTIQEGEVIEEVPTTDPVVTETLEPTTADVFGDVLGVQGPRSGSVVHGIIVLRARDGALPFLVDLNRLGL